MKYDFKWPSLDFLKKPAPVPERHLRHSVFIWVLIGLGLYIVKDWFKLKSARKPAHRAVDQINNPFFEVECREAIHH